MRLAIGVSPADLKIPPQPRATETGSRFDHVVTWCVRKRDVDGRWSWGEARAWTCEEWDAIIEPAFSNLQELTWGSVHAQASGEGHRLHHEHELSTIVAEAQDRWLDLGFEEFDTLFRFRLGNTRRFWGFVLQGHFFGVWWDRTHSIYPTN